MPPSEPLNAAGTQRLKTYVGEAMPPTGQTPKIALNRADAAHSLSMSVESFDLYVRPFIGCVYVGRERRWAVRILEEFVIDQSRRSN